MIACVFLDVGGTLLPSRWTSTETVQTARINQLHNLLPQFHHTRIGELERTLHTVYAEHRRSTYAAHSQAQDTNSVIRTVLEQFDLSSDLQSIEAVRSALRVTPVGHTTVIVGTEALLQHIKDWKLKCVVVSNATWRDNEAYQCDFEELGIARYIDGYVSSVDVGYHKPHRAMFDAALALAQCSPGECVMIGNSEAKDIQPAVALGMHAILITRNESPPVTSAAYATVDSLPAVLPALQTLILSEQGIDRAYTTSRH